MPAQQSATPKSTSSEAHKLVAELKDDAGWERAAAQLVLLRSKATKPLADSLQTAVKQGNDKLARRILAVLARLGLDASEATNLVTNLVTNALAGVGDDLLGIGFSALTQITPARGRDSTQIRAILTKIATRVGGGRGRGLSVGAPVFEGKTEIDPNATVEALLLGLKKSHFRSGDGYCQLLGQRGREAKPALAALGSRLLTQVAISPKWTEAEPFEVQFARNAAIAILHIDPTSKEAAYAYGYLILAEPFRDLRLRAARELMASPHIASATPFLVEALGRGNNDGDLVRAVINCLAIVGPKAEAATPMLEKLVDGNDEKTAAKAKSALRRIRGTGNDESPLRWPARPQAFR